MGDKGRIQFTEKPFKTNNINMGQQQNEWQLISLSISFNDWGKHKGTYTGAVKFKNGQEIDVNFMLNGEESRQFLSIVSDKIKEHAIRMTQLMVSNMPLMLNESPDQNP